MHLLHTTHRFLAWELISRELILIGRGEVCDIQLDDPSVSRVHCRLLVQDGKVFLTDAGSRWGTFVNGKRVQEAELYIGDSLQLGETELILVADGNAAVTTLAKPPTHETTRIVDPERMQQEEFSSSPVLEEQDVAQTPQKPFPMISRPFVPSRFLGKQFDRYQIELLLANTRSGMVFQAFDSGLKRSVAIKFYRPDMIPDETTKKRFFRAVRTMVDIRHPNIVKLFDAGNHEDLCFTICEYVEGESATKLIERIGIAGMLDFQKTVNIASDLCNSLSELHNRGIVHRNIRPEHIMIRKADQSAVLSDVIYAKAWDSTQLEQLTQAGDLVGDLTWQSPEQLGSGDPVDHRSDLYQLGLTLYVLLTGKNPFTDISPSTAIDKILSATPESPRSIHLNIPDHLSDLVMKMLSKEVRNRFDSVQTIKKELLRIQKYYHS